MTTVISPANVLPHSQRLRLIRSIRKLGDLLTETSMLVEPSPNTPLSPSTSPTPQLPVPSILADKQAQSLISTSTLPRSFFSLRLPKSPLSPTFSLSLNSPSTPVVDPAVVAERKLAKVVHTLGENVPPELVLAQPTAAGAGKGRKRSSTVSVPERPLAGSGDPAVGRRRRVRVVKQAASSASLRADANSTAMHMEPFSFPSLVPVHASQRSSQPEEALPSRSPTPPLPAARERTRTTSTAMHRKEAGWSGEWSGTVRNMDEVVRGLRGLRLK
ncbi:hypothetical protein B0H11DRAFT_1996072 [Mycena galericulata]|nr:hypothetical protein B0H11DRAFT_1996072 [Mycena galericulata]